MLLLFQIKQYLPKMYFNMSLYFNIFVVGNITGGIFHDKDKFSKTAKIYSEVDYLQSMLLFYL